MATKTLRLRNKTLGVINYRGTTVPPGGILTIEGEARNLDGPMMRGDLEAISDKEAEATPIAPPVAPGAAAAAPAPAAKPATK